MTAMTDQIPAAVPVPPPADRAALRAVVVEAVERLHETGGLYALGAGEAERIAAAVLAVLPEPTDQTASELASLAVNAGRALQDEKRHYEIACQENARLRATLDRIREAVRRLAAHAEGFRDVLDDSDRDPWAKTVGADIAELRRMAAEEQLAPCVECGHPKTVHRDGDDPVTPGECSACPEDDARHDHRPAVGEQPETQEVQPATVHAVPLPGSNGISSCCGRPPCEFVGQRVTRDPDEVTCRGPE